MPKIDTSVGELVDMIARGELRLPEMQRRYVWTSTRVRDLLDSLYRGYPSGSILVWETDQAQPSRDLAVQQSQSPFTGHKLLLDGQQRLTSLSAVLRGEPVIVKNRKRPIDIAFNLDHPEGPPTEILEIEDDSATLNGDDETILEGEDDEYTPSIQERLKQRTFVVASRALLSSPSWVLVSDIFKGEKTDWQLVKELVGSPDDPSYELYTKRLQRVRAIRNYMYVMQVLPRGFSYEEVAEIFVRVNSLGIKLRGSDLALALVTAKWPSSLKLFEEFIDECEEGWFTLDLGLIVRTLVVFATRQSRFRTVGTISIEKLKAAWEEAKNGLRFSINFLKANAGVEDESLLSSPFLMIPIAVLGVLRDERLSNEDERNLLRWLYIANARAHYSSSSETKLDVDLNLLFRGNGPESLMGPLESQFARLNIEPSDFAGRGARSALFSLAYLALKHAGAKDWFSGLGLSLTHQGRYHFIQFHHIFPKSLLQQAGYEKSEINEIANMAFITGRTNRRISNKTPGDYFKDIIQLRGEDTLRHQKIPMDQELWKIENYRDFLEERRKLLAASINEFINRAYETGSVTVFQSDED
ncbi:MAG: DUF262 domain-containing protein [Blastocatellia bacterium]|nr:DUF262 domain-containing protein [Blastocatellia bacterium]